MDIDCDTGALKVCCDNASDAARDDVYNYGCHVAHNAAYYECDVGRDNAHDNACDVARDVAYDDAFVLYDVSYMTMRPMLRAILLMIMYAMLCLMQLMVTRRRRSRCCATLLMTLCAMLQAM